MWCWYGVFNTLLVGVVSSRRIDRWRFSLCDTFLLSSDYFSSLGFPRHRRRFRRLSSQMKRVWSAYGIIINGWSHMAFGVYGAWHFIWQMALHLANGEINMKFRFFMSESLFFSIVITWTSPNHCALCVFSQRFSFFYPHYFPNYCVAIQFN